MIQEKNILAGLDAGKWVIVGLMFAGGAVLYGYLPEMIPSHWNANNVIDGWMPKIYGVWMMPAIALAMAVLFPLLKHLDPKKENYDQFKIAWGAIQTSLIGLMGYIFAITMYMSVYPQKSAAVGPLIIFGIGTLFLVLGRYMRDLKPNYFVGLRTPWTLNNPRVWQKSHEVAGKAFMASGIATMLCAIIWPPYIWLIFIAITILATIIPVAYSYFEHKRLL